MRYAMTVLLGCLLCCACRRAPSAPPVELPAALAAELPMDDPRVLAQLVQGVYRLEGGWRWAAPRFSFVLRSPGGNVQLELDFTIPAPVAEQLLPLTLTATAGGVDLGPETFTRSGAQRYLRRLPASVAAEDAVVVEFRSNRSIPPTPAEHRELALAVTRLSLTAP
jgi:hypothetical protein